MDHEARQVHAALRSRPADPFPLRIGRHHGTLAPPAGILPYGRHPSKKDCISCYTTDPFRAFMLTELPRKSLCSYVSYHLYVTCNPCLFPHYHSTEVLSWLPSLFPKCNFSITHNQPLCRSNQLYSPLTETLSHCSITTIQEESATLRQPHKPKIRGLSRLLDIGPPNSYIPVIGNGDWKWARKHLERATAKG